MAEQKRNPFSDAMQNVLERTGTETDEDLITYNKLKPYHFRAFNRRYGTKNVNRYIKIMEARRQGIPRIGEDLDGV